MIEQRATIYYDSAVLTRPRSLISSRVIESVRMEERMREVALLSRARSLSTPFLRPSPSLVSNLDPFGYKRGREIAALADPLTHPMLSGEIISAGAREHVACIIYQLQGTGMDEFRHDFTLSSAYADRNVDAFCVIRPVN